MRRERDGKLELLVEDNGKGCPEHAKEKVWARASCVCSLNSLGLRLDARQQILDVECRWLSLSAELVNAPKAASPSLATPWASIRGEIIETGLADRLRVRLALAGRLVGDRSRSQTDASLSNFPM
jgi:hypothetical protein